MRSFPEEWDLQQEISGPPQRVQGAAEDEPGKVGTGDSVGRLAAWGSLKKIMGELGSLSKREQGRSALHLESSGY